MITVEEYRAIRDEQRRLDIRVEAYDATMAAGPGVEKNTAARRLAELLAAEASIQAEEAYPGATRIVFRVANDEIGPTVLILEIHGTGGRELYRDDDPAYPYYDDQSEPGDKLGGALTWDSSIFGEIGGIYTYAWRPTGAGKSDLR